MHTSSLIRIGKIATSAVLAFGLVLSQPATIPSTAKAAANLGYNGKIVYGSWVIDNYEIFIADSDGSNAINLTNSPGSDRQPKWSPDGSKIVFYTNRDGNYEIYVMDADGSNLTRLTNNLNMDLTPSWHPSGSSIVFVSDRDGDGEIFIMNADGSNQTQLTNNTAADRDPDISPNGDKIVFESDRSGGDRIYTMDVSGLNQSILSSVAGTSDWYPRWTPDGSQILFTAYQPPDYYSYGILMKITADGSNLQTFIDIPNHGIDAVRWSPDGSTLLLNVWNGDYSEVFIYAADPDGSNQRQILSSANWDEYPDWQPILNMTPETMDDTLTTPYNTASSVDVLANDTDEEALDGQYLTIASQPLNGVAEVVTGMVKYSPNNGFKGSDQLTYEICDSFMLDQQCSTGILSITIQNPEAPALAVSKIAGIDANTSTGNYETSTKRPTFSGTASPGAEINVEIHSDPILLTTMANDDGSWSVTPSTDLPTGEHTIYISATLNGVTTELDSFVLTITNEATPANEIPDTGASMAPLRTAGFLLLVTGIILTHRNQRRKLKTTQIPSLF